MNTADPSSADVDDYRSLMSAFPTGVAVVTSLDTDAQPRGATCSSLCSVTLTPPTLLLCLNTTSSTLSAIRGSGGFAVNLLNSCARDTAVMFSTPVDDRFAAVAWRRFGSSGQPWLVRDAFAVAECRATELSTVGSHTVVLGRVVSSFSLPGVPLLYGLRQFSRWAPQLQETHPCAPRARDE